MPRVIASLCVLILISVSCKSPDIAPENRPNLRALSTTELAVTSANNDFAFTLFRTLQNEDNKGNIFISPLSVTTALSMAMNGACDSTRQSILKMLKFGNSNPLEVDQACKDLSSLLTSMDCTVQLGLANSAWNNIHHAVRDTFATIIKNYFGGTVQGLNFADPASVDVINGWVETNTHHLIKNILDFTSEYDAIFVINAIYFKGNWTYQFDPSKTYPAPFFQEDSSFQNVTTMFSKGSTIGYFRNQNFSLIDIPYGNKQFSMTILMPSVNYSVQKLTKALTADSLTSWLAKSYEVSPELELPKFKMNWKKDLKEDLMSLGMNTTGFPFIFKENLPLEITKVIHQSFIDVDEKGTEAAAATVVEIGLTTTGPRGPFKIQINRPFIYLIREKHSDAILFIGQMIYPQQ